MTTRIEDLTVQLADLDPGSERAKHIQAEIKAEEDKVAEAEGLARRTEAVRLKERLAEVETATKAAAPERAVKRSTSKRG